MVFFTRFEFEFSFEFEFVLKYGNKIPIQPYMVIYQIQEVFIFVQKSTKKLKNVTLQNTIRKLSWPT